jgi:hypothetical protein
MPAINKCDHCGRPFGMIRYRWWTQQLLPPCLLRHRRFTTRAQPHLFEEARGGAGRTVDLQPRQVAGFFIATIDAEPSVSELGTRGPSFRTIHRYTAWKRVPASATEEAHMRVLVMESINALSDRWLIIQEARKRALTEPGRVSSPVTAWSIFTS